MPASLIEPKKPFQTWTSTQAGKSHQPISPSGSVVYCGVSQLCHEDRSALSSTLVVCAI